MVSVAPAAMLAGLNADLTTVARAEIGEPRAPIVMPEAFALRRVVSVPMADPLTPLEPYVDKLTLPVLAPVPVETEFAMVSELVGLALTVEPTTAPAALIVCDAQPDARG